jgi:hypothetical protein
VSLPLLNVGMLDCMAMDVAPPYQTALGGIHSGCLSPGCSWWDGSSGVEGSPKWSHEEVRCEQSPAPTVHRASLEGRIELFGPVFFSWKSVSFSSTSFSKVVECVIVFPRLWPGHPTPTQPGSAQFPSLFHQTGMIFSLHYFFLRGAICLPDALDYLLLSRANDASCSLVEVLIY